MKRRGFSLIELLVVISIVSVLVGLLVPAFASMGRAQSLTSGASSIVDALALARQTALAQNRVVEVRFYKRRENPDFPVDPIANPEQFRSFRTVVYDGKVLNYSPLGAMQSLPQSVIIMEDLEFSTLIFPYSDTVPNRSWQKEKLSGGQEEVEYQFIRFKPTGGTDLAATGTPDSDKWFLTVKLSSDPKVGGKPANNYVTAVLDPVSGRSRTYRP